MDPEYKRKLASLGLQFGIKSIDPNLKHKKTKKVEELEGIEGQNSLGNFFYKEQDFKNSYVHGAIDFTDYNQQLSIITDQGNLLKINIEECFFLDTETTGLSVSGGTFAFMIGIGYFRQGIFYLRQYFLKETTQEDAMLLDLLNLSSLFTTVVTYNGISFDLPIIKSRLRYHRIPHKLQEINHIDLLKYARMFFRFQFNNRSLKNIESKVLYFERAEEEIPGYLAPVIYQEYLVNKEINDIEGVFYHNAMDIVSLAALLVVINQISTQNEELLKKYETLNFSLAKQFERNKIFEKALETYLTSAKQSNLPESIRLKCLLAIAQIYKKQNQIELAVQYWEKASQHQNYEAYIELSKIYEHKLKNYSLAIEYCEKALLILESDIDSISNRVMIEACNHRLRRIISKAKK